MSLQKRRHEIPDEWFAKSDVGRLTNEQLIMLVSSLEKPKWVYDGDCEDYVPLDSSGGLYFKACDELKRRLAPR